MVMDMKFLNSESGVTARYITAALLIGGRAGRGRWQGKDAESGEDREDIIILSVLQFLSPEHHRDANSFRTNSSLVSRLDRKLYASQLRISSFSLQIH